MRVSGKNLACQVQKRADIKPECALVLGGGISGATVGKRLSEAGWEVHLVEKQATIGGCVVEMGCKATDICLRCNVCVANELLRAVAASPTGYPQCQDACRGKVVDYHSGNVVQKRP